MDGSFNSWQLQHVLFVVSERHSLVWKSLIDDFITNNLWSMELALISSQVPTIQPRHRSRVVVSTMAVEVRFGVAFDTHKDNDVGY